MTRPALHTFAHSTLILALGLGPGCRSAEPLPDPTAEPGAPVETAVAQGAPEEVPEFEVIRLEYCVASELAAVIQDLIADASAPGEPEVKVLADQRTNSLLLMASPERMPEIKELIAALDVEATAGG